MVFLSLTFDYELFFGDNYGTYDEVLFLPAYKLIDALEQKSVSATFFADVCSIPASKKYDQNSYVEGFQNQIQYMVQHGQDVQLHLHPHWYNSTWSNGRWNFSTKGYRLHEFDLEQRINAIIRDGIKYLNETARLVDTNYDCIAYRAGGFSIQPHGKIVKCLYDNGIRIDSSVAPGLYTWSKAHYYDYRHELSDLNWKISEDMEWWENCSKTRGIIEFPIATVDKSPVPFFFRRLFKPDTIKNQLGTKRGTYISIGTQTSGKLRQYFKYFTERNTISLDAYAAEYLYTQIKRFYRKNNCEEKVVSIIGHPKLVNEKYIDNLNKFIDMINNDKRFQFISIYDAYKMKGL